MSQLSDEEIEHRLGCHKAGEDAVARMRELRAIAVTYAKALNRLVPDGREKAEAMTCLEHASMFAIAGIARREPLDLGG
jgi:hypothetical protein